MALISVIVPVYKVEKYLARCIESVLAQTFKDFELILVDDGSPDHCGELCEKYKKIDCRIIVIHQPNQGLSAARNTGIDWSFLHSDSKWITFIDSDDWVQESYLEYLYKATIENDVDMSCCEYLRVYDSVDENGLAEYAVELMDPERYYTYYNNGNEMVAWGKLYKKELFEGIRYPVGRIHEDNFTTPKLIFKVNQIAVIHTKLYYYLMNADGITQQKFSIRNYDFVLAKEDLMRFFSEAGNQRMLDKELENYNYVLAKYSILARKAGIYRQLQTKYKLSWFKANKIIHKQLPEDQYEFEMFKYYPKYIKLRAIMKRIFKRNVL